MQGKKLLSQRAFFLLLTSSWVHVTMWHTRDLAFPQVKVSAGVNVFGLMAADFWFPAAKAEFNLKLPSGRTGQVTGVYESATVTFASLFYS